MEAKDSLAYALDLKDPVPQGVRVRLPAFASNDLGPLDGEALFLGCHYECHYPVFMRYCGALLQRARTGPPASPSAATRPTSVTVVSPRD
jgi:hypothetical protein